MLLIGAGLLICSFLRLQRTDLGCDPHGLLTFRYRFASTDYSKPISNYKGLVPWDVNLMPVAQFRQIFDRLQTVPGVIAVGGSMYPRFTGNKPVNFTISGQDARQRRRRFRRFLSGFAQFLRGYENQAVARFKPSRRPASTL